jgi:hypothetical protein
VPELVDRFVGAWVAYLAFLFVDETPTRQIAYCLGGVIVGIALYMTLFPIMPWDLLLSGLVGSVAGFVSISAGADPSGTWQRLLWEIHIRRFNRRRFDASSKDLV